VNLAQRHALFVEREMPCGCVYDRAREEYARHMGARS